MLKRRILIGFLLVKVLSAQVVVAEEAGAVVEAIAKSYHDGVFAFMDPFDDLIHVKQNLLKSQDKQALQGAVEAMVDRAFNYEDNIRDAVLAAQPEGVEAMINAALSAYGQGLVRIFEPLTMQSTQQIIAKLPRHDRELVKEAFTTMINQAIALFSQINQAGKAAENRE